MFLGIAIAVWVGSSILAYGMLIHEYNSRFNYFRISIFAKLMCLLGPCMLGGVVFAHGGKWGINFKPYSDDERWENFNQLYNQYFVYKTREEFDKEY